MWTIKFVDLIYGSHNLMAYIFFGKSISEVCSVKIELLKI